MADPYKQFNREDAREDPYAQLSPASTGGDPYAKMIAPEGNGDPYMSLLQGSGVDEQEQDVIQRINNPQKETPSYFGFTEIPSALSSGFEANLRTAFRGLVAGQALKTGDYAAEIAESPINADMTQSEQQRGRAAREYLGSMSNALKIASDNLYQKNKDDIVRLGLAKPESTLGGAAYDVGGAFGSFLPTIGATVLTRNPSYATAYFWALQDSETYKESIEAGKTPYEARVIAATTATGVAAIEQIGGHFFLNAIKESPIVKRIVARSVAQGAEEGAQAIVEESVLGYTEVRDKTFKDAAGDVAYALAIGTIASAPITSTVTAIEDIAMKRGLSKKDAEKLAKEFVENKDDVMEAAVSLVNKDASGVVDDKFSKQEALKAADAVFVPKEDALPADKSGAMEQAQVEGEPLRITIPNINAQTKNTPESQIEWLDKSATRFDEMAADAEKAGDTEAANNAKVLAEGRRKQIEEIQIESAKRANEFLIPIQQEEKRAQQKQLENIQAQTDDISLNLLREVTALQEDKSIVDPETLTILEDTASLLNERRKTPKPVTLIEFLKKLGGIKEYSGELQTMGMKNRSSARNDKNGLELDMAREAAAEAGYIDADSTVTDFLAALESEYKGQPVISEKDIGIQSRLDEIDDTLAKLDEALDKSGQGTYSRERLGDLRRRVAENKKLDKATAREIKKREGELHRLAADKKLAEQSPPKILADKMTTFLQGLRKGTYLGRYEALDVQNQLIDMIEQSGLDAADRAKFIRTIKNTQTIEQLQGKMPEIIERVERLADAAKRRSLVSKIKSSLETARKSNIIAVDFVNRIEDLVNEIDTQGRTEKTINSLQKTLDYLQRNPDADMPKRVLNKLEILNKKPLEDVTTEELQSIADGIADLVKKGKLKFELLQNKKERLKQKRIEALQKATVPINEVSMANRNIGERLTLMDGAKNKFREYQNRAKRVGVATNPMDVFFDMMDGGKKYLGENYRIFKKTIDESFSRYLDRRESATRDVKNLADKLDLNDLNFEKIGAWAVLQQEGGEKKLLDSGVTQKEIDALQLDEKEMQMYQLMREKLDEQLPDIQRVMREVYNMNVEAVSDYFPFMTDHDAMSGVEIQDQFGPNTPSIAKKKNVEKGMTISRTLGSQKVRIDAMGVFLRHMDNATYLIEMGKDIKELGDVAQSKEYKESAGDLGQQMVVEWINLLARKGNLPGRIAIVDTLRRNVGAAMLGFKLSTVMIQVTALADGATLVGGNYVAQGSYNIGTSREWRQFILKNFPEVRERVGDDQAYLDGGPEGVVKNIREAGYWALKEIDAMVASSIAAGAYTRAVESRGGEVDFNKPDADAITEAQMMMRRTQSSPFAKDAPALFTQGKMSGNVSLDKAILQFQSFMFNRWSLIKHDMWELGIKQGDMARAMNVATWLIIANIAEMGLRRGAEEIISAITGDDEDRDEDDITAKAILTTLNNVPFVSQAVSTFEYGGVPVPSAGMLYRIGNELRWVAQSEDEDKRMQHALSAIALIAGTSYGLPGTIQAESIMRKSLKDE